MILVDNGRVICRLMDFMLKVKISHPQKGEFFLDLKFGRT
ncbi:conserved hypothetical protein [delta proteobacterium NaphS2]|nr:conserved hypothetical protein [delta proteobacterium NaphS2]EFK10705.1 conserved hypothetical protein [delta proteobacterium NaphS2]